MNALPLWKRRWVQVTGSSALAFFVGLGMSGGSTDGMVTQQKAQALVDQAAQQAHDDATEAAERDVLTSPAVVAALGEERAKSVAAQAKLRASQQRIRKLTSQRDQARSRAAEQARSLVQSAPEPEPEPEPQASGDGTDPRFGTCGEANDNGYGPYQRGVDAEYDWYQDRDGDGRVCES